MASVCSPGREAAFDPTYPGYTSRLKGVSVPNAVKVVRDSKLLMAWLVAFCFILIKTKTAGQWTPALNLARDPHQALPPLLLELNFFPIAVLNMSESL